MPLPCPHVIPAVAKKSTNFPDEPKILRETSDIAAPLIVLSQRCTRIWRSPKLVPIGIIFYGQSAARHSHIIAAVQGEPRWCRGRIICRIITRHPKLRAVRSVLDRDVTQLVIGILREAGHVNVACAVESHLDSLVCSVANAIVVPGNPGLLDLRCAVVARH